MNKQTNQKSGPAMNFIHGKWQTMLLALGIIGVSGCLPAEEQQTVTANTKQEIPVALHPIRESWSAPIPFYQAVPFAKGELSWTGRNAETQSWQLSGADKQETVVLARPAAFWSDGSVRWLSVEGIWPANYKGGNSLSLRPIQEGAENSSSSSWQVVAEAGKQEIRVVKPDGTLAFALFPEASRVQIGKPRTVLPTDIEWSEKIGQYTWAQPLGDLNDNPQSEQLSLVVVRHEVEEQTALYTLHRIQGRSTADSGYSLEWQVRLKIYPETGMIRSEFTWKVLWDVASYALSSAVWKFQFPESIQEVRTLQEKGASLQDNQVWLARSEANGDWGVFVQSDTETGLEAADIGQESFPNELLLKQGQGWVGVAIPNFSKMGPGHWLAHGNVLEIGAWSEFSEKALDLRCSGQPDEFGVRVAEGSVVESRLESDGRGFAHTLEATFVLGQKPEVATVQLASESEREGLWFASPADLERTSAIEPFSQQVIKDHPDYFAGLHINMLFLVRSRDYWKWYGMANYGDYRTNFARGTQVDRGLYAGHWALNGRYGWRNGSGGITGGILKAGLLLGDREITLAGMEHARHIADVDIQHGSFFRPYRRDEGGMHRRNRDHWSGSVQMQYSPTSGIYLASWLGGNHRVRDALAGVRDFSTRNANYNSAFAAQAWIYRYMETLNEEDYLRAREYLEGTAAWWAEHSEKRIPGIGTIYAGNFRRISDGLTTVMAFYEATGKEEYLEAIKTSMIENGMEDRQVSAMQKGYVLAWLMEHGVPRQAFAGMDLSLIDSEIEMTIPSPLGDFSKKSYEELVSIVVNDLPPTGSSAYRESNAISRRAKTAFLTLRWYKNFSK